MPRVLAIDVSSAPAAALVCCLSTLPHACLHPLGVSCCCLQRHVCGVKLAGICVGSSVCLSSAGCHFIVHCAVLPSLTRGRANTHRGPWGPQATESAGRCPCGHHRRRCSRTAGRRPGPGPTSSTSTCPTTCSGAACCCSHPACILLGLGQPCILRLQPPASCSEHHQETGVTGVFCWRRCFPGPAAAAADEQQGRLVLHRLGSHTCVSRPQ